MPPFHYRLLLVPLSLLLLPVAFSMAEDVPQDPASYQRRNTWAETMAETRKAWQSHVDAEIRARIPLEALTPLKRVESRPEPLAKALAAVSEISRCLWRDFPHQMDWLLQDNKTYRGWGAGKYDARGDLAWYLNAQRDSTFERKLLDFVWQEMEDIPERFKTRRNDLAGAPSGHASWLSLYEELCRVRRRKRLAPLLEQTREVIFAKHQPFGSVSGIYLLTETEGCPSPGETALCILDLSCEAQGKQFAQPKVLFDPKGGIVRSPELHFDANKLLFSWRRTRKHWDTRYKDAPETGNYQIYEMNLSDRSVRQLTTDDYYGAAFEPCYLPDGNIMFSSSRIVQHITCGWGDCSNLFLMDADGRHQRRIGFDQTNTAFPELLEDGRVIFTRRDYNDRGQVYAHALFVTNPDGSLQREYYGNNTVHPTSFQHARSIPGTGKVLCIVGGYHSSQGGKLAVMDVRRGYQDFEGINIIPPGESVEGTGGDRFGKVGAQYANPEPITPTSCLVSIAPIGGYGLRDDGRIMIKTGSRNWFYNVYYMTFDGRRELLAADPGISCLEPIAVRKRPRPPVLTSSVDWSQEDGVMYVQDVYKGDGLKGVRQGSVRKLRVVALEYKPLTCGGVTWRARGGYGHSVTPVGIGSGTYDAKSILGDVKVHEDGSAMFVVPARKPIYIQALDEENRVIQTMRSWATLMPGENLSCVGCHERKDETPERAEITQAMRNGPVRLEPFHGPPRGFSYLREIQPILDKHCIKCHNTQNIDKAKRVLTDQGVPESPGSSSRAARIWPRSYLELTGAANPDLLAGKPKAKAGPGNPDGEWVNWFPRLALQTLQPAYDHGSSKSRLWTMLHNGHKKVKLSQQELDKIAAWMDLGVPLCGDYFEANNWPEDKRAYYRHRMQLRTESEQMEAGNIRRMLSGPR